MFWTYWILITLAIIGLAVLTCKNARVQNYLGMVVGQLASNNNWRWGAILVLAVIFTISAVLAGFGKPLLISSAKEVKASLTERVDNYPQAKSEVNSLLWGTNGVSPMLAPTRVIEKEYSSWWHWKIAILLWLVWLIYTPFAFSDEAARAIKATIKAVERRKRLNNIRASSVATSIATPATPTPATGVVTSANLFRQLLRVEVLTEALEIFFKLLIKRMGGLFK